jgi:chromosome segregation ATPase
MLTVGPAFHPLYADSLQDQLNQIEQDLATIAKNKQDLQGAIDSQNDKIGQYSGAVGQLNGQVQALQLDISQLDLQIKEVNVNIQILNNQITQKKLDIQTNEVHIATLETESDIRIQNNYMDYRLHKSDGVDFFTVKNANTYFKDSQYNEIIQSDTNKVLQDLADSKVQMQKDQADLEEKSVNVERNKAMLDEQHSQLDRKQADLKAQMNSYNLAIYNAQNNINGTKATIDSLSQEELQKQAQRDQLRQQLFYSYSPITGHYVVAGTVFGYQGATG